MSETSGSRSLHATLWLPPHFHHLFAATCPAIFLLDDTDALPVRVERCCACAGMGAPDSSCCFIKLPSFWNLPTANSTLQIPT